MVAFVQPAGPGLTAAERDRHCRDDPMLAHSKGPRGCRFVAALPRTETGKKMHYKVREEAGKASGIGEFERP